MTIIAEICGIVKVLRLHRLLQICGHVHDELIIECPEDTDVSNITSIMDQSPAWMPGILIRGDGYETKFYKKD